MAEIVDLGQHRRQMEARRGFQGWNKRFEESFDENTRIEDLSDSVLWTLIQGGNDSSLLLYELIMGVEGLGPGPRFYSLEPSLRMAVMDTALFLLDQLRFEAMKRLRWAEDLPSFHIPLVDLINNIDEDYNPFKAMVPILSSTHPGYVDYAGTFEPDRGRFIRKLIPEALEAFQKRVNPE